MAARSVLMFPTTFHGTRSTQAITPPRPPLVELADRLVKCDERAARVFERMMRDVLDGVRPRRAGADQ